MKATIRTYWRDSDKDTRNGNLGGFIRWEPTEAATVPPNRVLPYVMGQPFFIHGGQWTKDGQCKVKALHPSLIAKNFHDDNYMWGNYREVASCPSIDHAKKWVEDQAKIIVAVKNDGQIPPPICEKLGGKMWKAMYALLRGIKYARLRDKLILQSLSENWTRIGRRTETNNNTITKSLYPLGDIVTFGGFDMCALTAVYKKLPPEEFYRSQIPSINMSAYGVFLYPAHILRYTHGDLPTGYQCLALDDMWRFRCAMQDLRYLYSQPLARYMGVHTAEIDCEYMINKFRANKKLLEIAKQKSMEDDPGNLLTYHSDKKEGKWTLASILKIYSDYAKHLKNKDL